MDLNIENKPGDSAYTYSRNISSVSQASETDSERSQNLYSIEHTYYKPSDSGRYGKCAESTYSRSILEYLPLAASHNCSTRESKEEFSNDREWRFKQLTKDANDNVLLYDGYTYIPDVENVKNNQEGIYEDVTRDNRKVRPSRVSKRTVCRILIATLLSSIGIITAYYMLFRLPWISDLLGHTTAIPDVSLTSMVYDKRTWNKTLMTSASTETTSGKISCDSFYCKHGGTCYEEDDSLKCHCISGWGGLNCDFKLIDCEALKKVSGIIQNGIYDIFPPRLSQMRVYCDMESDDHGWIVFQRRYNGSVDFYRSWVEYKNGFGDIGGEFWLGNNFLHAFTSGGLHQLRVDLGDWHSEVRFAVYDAFSVSSEAYKYRLQIGAYRGDAGDSMRIWNNGQRFSTKDQDNDSSPSSCAEAYKGAWWFSDCFSDHLNGVYKHQPNSSCSEGIIWWGFRKCTYSLKFSEMKFRSIRFDDFNT